MVELVPAPWTSTEVSTRACAVFIFFLFRISQVRAVFVFFLSCISQVRAGARALMAEVGQGPVSLSREVPGFVLNRMQVVES